MSNEAVFQGTIGRVSTVPSRGVVLVTVECPIEHHGLVARIAVHGQHVAVAAIQTPPEKATEKEPRKWSEITPASQAGILCPDVEFQEFLGVKSTDEAIQLLYRKFDIFSRSEISTNSRAARLWAELVIEFRVWQQARP